MENQKYPIAEEIVWWKKTTVYQIYPRSFKDSTGNGIGDLRGIISKLDYLKDLGVETIWFSPFYPSPTTIKPYPQHDCGYDIMNYRDINPEYGTMEDFNELLEGLHQRGMKMVLDMVMNHTSEEHPWFKESRSSKDNPKRNWYIWADGKNKDGKKPPTNWRAMPMGQAWHYDEHTNQWYYAEFLPFQPDLNYRNPEVQKEMLDTVRFWLKKGVDGYRLDIINALFEEEELKDAPFTPKVFSEDLDVLFKSAKYQLNHPDTLDFCKKLRSTIDEFPDKFMVGEVAASFSTLQQYLGDIDGNSYNGLNLIFLFQSLAVPLKAKKIRNLIELYEKWFYEPYCPTLVFGNHDQMRRISRFGGSLEKAKINAAFQLTSRGVPFIYYGEEIGIEHGEIKAKNSKDAVVHHARQFAPYFLLNIPRKLGFDINRDNCRTPMQWDTSNSTAGFSPSDVETWLPVHKDYIERNVAVQTDDEHSLLNCYKRLLDIRKKSLSLQCGSIELIEIPNCPKSLLAYSRKAIISSDTPEKFDQSLIFLNFSDKPIEFLSPILNSEANLVFSTKINSQPLTENTIKLNPWESIILQ